MTTLEKIKHLDDNEVITLYQNFSRKLLNEVDLDPVSIIQNPPEELTDDKIFRKIDTNNLDALDTALIPDEVIPSVRRIVEAWAGNPEMAPVIEDFLTAPQERTLAAGAILALGSVLVMTIVSSSIKIEIKDGKFSFKYDSAGSKNAVSLVKAVLSGIPDTIKMITSK
jgi:hypothetical protein